MTKQEKDAIAAMIKKSHKPSVTHAQYEGGKRIEMNELPEAARLLESDDYQKGWEACHLQMTEALKFICSGKPKELLRYARR